MSLKEDLDLIRKRVEELLSENKSLRDQLKREQQETESIKNDRLELENRINELENKTINLQLAKSLKGEKPLSEGLLKKIDTYIKEIDECIDLLKN